MNLYSKYVFVLKIWIIFAQKILYIMLIRLLISFCSLVYLHRV